MEKNRDGVVVTGGRTGEGILRALRESAPAVSIFGAVVMLACDMLGIRLNPAYNAFTQGISELALTSTGWLEKLAFGILGLSILLTAAALYSSVLSGRRRLFRTMSLLLGLNGLGFIVISIFNTKAPGTPDTTTSLIHTAAAIVAGSIPSLYALIFAAGFFKYSRLRPYLLYSLLVGMFAGVGGLVYLTLPRGTWFGLGLYERSLGMLTLIWLALAGTGLLRVANAPEETPHDRWPIVEKR